MVHVRENIEVDILFINFRDLNSSKTNSYCMVGITYDKFFMRKAIEHLAKIIKKDFNKKEYTGKGKTTEYIMLYRNSRTNRVVKTKKHKYTF